MKWRHSICATSPLAKLTVDSNGIAISPSWGGMRFLWRLFGLPLRQWEWPEVETAALARSLVGARPRGVTLRVAGKRLDFRYVAPMEVLDEIARFVPLKISGQASRVFL
jgi:hypothetical protein